MARIRRRDRRVGLVTDPTFALYSPPSRLIADRMPFPFDEPVPHPLQPRILQRTLMLIDQLGYGELCVRLHPQCASDADLRSFHTPDYIERVQEISRTGGTSGSSLIVTHGAEPIARLAVGAAVCAVDAVMTGSVHHTFSLARPGGHHAWSEKGAFHSIYNSVVIAALHARFSYRLTRIAIIDWDAHHGSGTQEAFEADPGTLLIDLHQEDLWPVGWGAASQSGTGVAAGTTVNVPFPAGTGNAAYLTAMDQLVAPVLHAFRPELIIVNAGQDGSVEDPLSRLSLTTAAYRAMTTAFRKLAEDLCDGRLVVLLEGGYSEHYTPYCTAAVVEGLCAGMGNPLPVDEPYGPRAEAMAPTRMIGRDARHALNEVIDLHQRWWPLEDIASV